MESITISENGVYDIRILNGGMSNFVATLI
jgi:hypothetical protein